MNSAKKQPIAIPVFQEMIHAFYATHKRSFSWRYVDDPYRVLISEIMLQQTQTERVIYKFEEFIDRFPTIDDLADASLAEVLTCWQGLGYNRRGKFLHETARIIKNEHNGMLPDEPSILKTFPGIGPATACSLATFAYNKPTIFIETNIRAVFIHHFFNTNQKVDDKEIFPLIEQTLDHVDPRSWYYALMDYGVFLKKNLSNPSRRSKHHAKQSRFEGSDRQIRGSIIRLLTKQTAINFDDLLATLNTDHERATKIINGLCREQLIKQVGQLLMIS